MIHRLHHMVSPPGFEQLTPSGRWVRGVPSPFHGGILDRMICDAWAVLTTKAYAVQWPELGEIDRLIAERRPKPPKGNKHAQD